MPQNTPYSASLSTTVAEMNAARPFVYADETEQNVLYGGQHIFTHRSEDCLTYWCFVHNRSPHHMTLWVQRYDPLTKTVYRICPHGVRHIDPDDQPPGVERKIHRRLCDGCCTPLTDRPNDDQSSNQQSQGDH